MKKIDLTGKRFGRLTVIEEAPTRVSPQGVKQVYWKCKCDCGTITEVHGNLLRRGTTISCGCYHREQQKKNAILKPKDMLGQRIGHLLVIEYAGSKHNLAMWKCLCDCGKTVIVPGAYLRAGHTNSCGANVHRKKHGGVNEKLYGVYRAMLQRCYNANNSQYDDYGGRGITVCDEWKDSYISFRDWAFTNGYREEVLPNGLNKWTIDRINVNGNYEPNNCRWITCQEQQFNKRDNVYITYNGETKTAKEFSIQYNISPDVLWQRLKHGWEVNEAIETPVKKRTCKIKETTAGGEAK